MSSSLQRSIFTAFDSAAYINREDRPDRRTATEAELSRVGITARRVAASMPSSRGRFPTSGYRGCYADHLSIIEHAAETRAASVLVMEDDVRFVRGDDGGRLYWLDNNSDWDMLFFYSTHGGEMVSPGILRIRGTMLAHCYAVHARAFSRVIVAMRSNDSVTVDNFYNRIMCPGLTCYAATPDMAKQRPSRSDITRAMRTTPS